MKMLEKIDQLMERKGITRAALSRRTGIPYTTICGFYDKGTSPRCSTLLKLATFLECSCDYLVNDDFEEPKYAPLDDVFTTTEASVIWGTTDDIIKSYAEKGEFLPSEARHTENIWLVTRKGMQCIFGDPIVKPPINRGKSRVLK